MNSLRQADDDDAPEFSDSMNAYFRAQLTSHMRVGYARFAAIIFRRLAISADYFWSY